MDASAIKTLPEVLSENQAPIIDTRADAKFAIVPKGMTIQSLKSIRDENKLVPDYRADHVTTSNLGSFIDHVKRYYSEDTVVFAKAPVLSTDIRTPIFAMKAVMDFHPAGADVTKAGAKKHIIDFVSNIHGRALMWVKRAGNQMSQIEFAEFIEENLSDLCFVESVNSPIGNSVGTPADILNLSRGLSVKVNHSVRNAVRLSSGESEVNFATENKTTAKDGETSVIVPEWFAIRIPFFVGLEQEPVVMLLRLRYRVRDGEITFSYLLNDLDKMIEGEVAKMVGLVRELIPDVHLVEGVHL